MGNGAFTQSFRLTTVTLGNGLEKIEPYTIYKCTSLEFIVIPRSVKDINQLAFHRSSNLTNVMFCHEIEQL
jgi:hypothetical protein